MEVAVPKMKYRMELAAKIGDKPEGLATKGRYSLQRAFSAYPSSCSARWFGYLLATLFLATLLASTVEARAFLERGALVEAADGISAARYPDADTVRVNDLTRVTYAADGTSETWSDTALKIITEKGKRETRTISLGFNISYGTNYFTRVEIIKPDGRVVEVDMAAQSRVVADPSQMSANIYNPNLKVAKLSVPGLEIGDVLRYTTRRVTSKTPVPGTWGAYQVFEGPAPIVKATYQVTAPDERPLARILMKDEVPGTVTFEQQRDEARGETTYIWRVQDVPRMFKEPNMPAAHTVVQRLLISTIEKWEELSRWYWNLCLPRMEAVSPAMISKVNDLAEGLTTMEQIHAIFRFVSQDIRYMGITTEEEAPGYEPHDVCITFENRYGVCRDKAALLVAMLRLADIEAFPVIIMVGPKKDEEVPQPFFNHAVTAALDDKGNYVLMDATAENTKDIFPAYLQNMSYLIARPDGETLLTSPLIPAEENLTRIAAEGTLDKGGQLQASASIRFEGINDTVYRSHLARLKPEERHRFFEGNLRKSMPSAKLERLEILPAELRDTTAPLVADLAYTASGLLVGSGTHAMLNLPRLGDVIGYANFLLGQTGLEERKYPLLTRATAGIEETLALKLPAELGHARLPDTKPVESGTLAWNRSLALADGLLKATNIFHLQAVEFSPEQYLDLKHDRKEIEYHARKRLIFDHPETEDSAKPDVRILERTIDIELDDPGHWRETRRTRMEILTYAGKKKYSEIKIGHNPAWHQVELTRAEVTLPDGTLKTIRPEEINIMDAGWSASAPRYPAEKILVASLPGVEIGSVLDYEIVSTVNGKPFFSTLQLFNGHDPIDLKTVRLTAPADISLQIRNEGVNEMRTETNGLITMVWSAEHQSSIPVEEDLPARWTFNPYIALSTTDWQTYGDSVHRHLLAATQKQPETLRLAKQITQSVVRPGKEQAVALRDWVALNLLSAGPNFTRLPFSAITPADRTLADRYGNNADRMVVLYTLLRAVGFKPSFVLSGQHSLVPEELDPRIEIPDRRLFNAVLVKLDIDGETLYFDGASHYAHPGATLFNRRRQLDLATGECSTIALDEDLADFSHTALHLAIDVEGRLELTQESLMQGTAFENFHQYYAEITPENRRRHHLEIVAGVSQSARATSELITDYKTYPGRLRFSVEAERYGVVDGDYLYFTLPDGFSDLIRYRSSQRTLPLVWSRYVNRQMRFTVQLPPGYTPLIMPRSFFWTAPANAGSVQVHAAFSKTYHQIEIEMRARLGPALIPAGEFPAIIEAGRRLAHPGMRTILLKKERGRSI